MDTIENTAAYRSNPAVALAPVANSAKCTADLFGNIGTIDQNGNVVYLDTQHQIREFHNRYSSDSIGASEILTSIVDPRIKAVPEVQTGSILDREISIFRHPVTNKYGKPITIREVIFKEILADKHAAITRQLRGKPTSTHQEVAVARDYKQSVFDYVTWSGVFPYHDDARLEKHSGIVCLDIDHLAMLLESIRQLVNSDPSVVASFVSPSGDGLKILYEADTAQHAQVQWYKAYAKRLRKLTGLKETYIDPLDGREKPHIDPTCSNVSRACFLPFDPSVYVNPALL